jgi:hypothetical protein
MNDIFVQFGRDSPNRVITHIAAQEIKQGETLTLKPFPSNILAICGKLMENRYITLPGTYSDPFGTS